MRRNDSTDTKGTVGDDNAVKRVLKFNHPLNNRIIALSQQQKINQHLRILAMNNYSIRGAAKTKQLLQKEQQQNKPGTNMLKCIDKWALDVDPSSVPFVSIPAEDNEWAIYFEERSEFDRPGEDPKRLPLGKMSKGIRNGGVKSIPAPRSPPRSGGGRTNFVTAANGGVGFRIQSKGLLFDDPQWLPDAYKWNVWTRLENTRASLDKLCPGMSRHFYCQVDDLVDSELGPSSPQQMISRTRLYSPCCKNSIDLNFSYIKVQRTFPRMQRHRAFMNEQVQCTATLRMPMDEEDVLASMEESGVSDTECIYDKVVLFGYEYCQYRHKQIRQMIDGKGLHRLQKFLFGSASWPAPSTTVDESASKPKKLYSDSATGFHSYFLPTPMELGRKLNPYELFNLLLTAAYVPLALSYTDVPIKWVPRDAKLNFYGAKEPRRTKPPKWKRSNSVIDNQFAQNAEDNKAHNQESSPHEAAAAALLNGGHHFCANGCAEVGAQVCCTDICEQKFADDDSCSESGNISDDVASNCTQRSCSSTTVEEETDITDCEDEDDEEIEEVSSCGEDEEDEMELDERSRQQEALRIAHLKRLAVTQNNRNNPLIGALRSNHHSVTSSVTVVTKAPPAPGGTAVLRQRPMTRQVFPGRLAVQHQGTGIKNEMDVKSQTESIPSDYGCNMDQSLSDTAHSPELPGGGDLESEQEEEETSGATGGITDPDDLENESDGGSGEEEEEFEEELYTGGGGGFILDRQEKKSAVPQPHCGARIQTEADGEDSVDSSSLVDDKNGGRQQQLCVIGEKIQVNVRVGGCAAMAQEGTGAASEPMPSVINAQTQEERHPADQSQPDTKVVPTALVTTDENEVSSTVDASAVTTTTTVDTNKGLSSDKVCTVVPLSRFTEQQGAVPKSTEQPTSPPLDQLELTSTNNCVAELDSVPEVVAVIPASMPTQHPRKPPTQRGAVGPPFRTTTTGPPNVARRCPPLPANLVPTILTNRVRAAATATANQTSNNNPLKRQRVAAAPQEKVGVLLRQQQIGGKRVCRRRRTRRRRRIACWKLDHKLCRCTQCRLHGNCETSPGEWHGMLADFR